MQACILPKVGEKLQLETRPLPQLGPDEVLIAVAYAALNHRDVYITQGLYPAIQTPTVLGSDLCGRIVGLGAKVDKTWLGRLVLAQPGFEWGDNPEVQSLNYHILGMPQDGALAEYCRLPLSHVYDIPQHLSLAQAAALPLAGLTAYRALLQKAKAKSGDKVFITGIGGGVALMALQLALSLDMEVYVSSGSQEKLDKALALGAKGGVNYRDKDWHFQALELCPNGFDVAIDSAGGPDFAKLIDLLRHGGRLAFYGGSLGKFTLSPQKMFWKQISIFGSTMGSPSEFEALLAQISDKAWQPVIDCIFPLSEAQAAFDYLAQGQQFGKVIIEVNAGV